MDPTIVVTILQAIIANLPAEQKAIETLVTWIRDMIAQIQNTGTISQADIDKLIADIQANSARIQSM